jgi:glycosyltransferase involved in cell wall biosynthesis
MARIAVVGLRGVPASWGGVEQQCEKIYSRLAARGYRITIYGRSGYVPEGIHCYRGMRIVRLPTIPTKYTETFVHTLLAMFHALRQKPDILHIYSQGPALFSPLVKLLKPELPIFFTCGGLDWQRRKWPSWAAKAIHLGEICSARFCDRCIMVSEDLKRYYEKEYGVTGDLIPNGVDRTEKIPPRRITQWGLQPGNYSLFVGRLVPEKRIEDLIIAHRSKPRSVKLAIVGDSAGTENYVASLKELAAFDPSILFLGFQFGEVLQELYSSARCFVTASELEGLPLTLLEALSFGLLCVASEIPPHVEVLSKTGGMLFRTGSVAALTEALEAVEKLSPSDLEKVEKQAIASVEEHYSWDKASEQLGNLYEASLLR